MVEKEIDFSHQPNVPENIIRTQSRWAQNIKPLKLVVAAYFICRILQLIHVEEKINDYHVIAILWKQKKFSKHHINTTTHQILRGKPSNIEGKTTRQLRKIFTMK